MCTPRYDGKEVLPAEAEFYTLVNAVHTQLVQREKAGHDKAACPVCRQDATA